MTNSTTGSGTQRNTTGISNQGNTIIELRRKLQSVESRAIRYKCWYGELWELLDELNNGADKDAVLERWLEYGMGGKK